MNARLYSRSAIILAAVLWTSRMAAAQPQQRPTVELTLADAVHRVIEHNPDLAIVGLDTEVEATRVGETRGAYSPLFQATLGRSRNTALPTNILLGDTGVDVSDWFTSTGV